MKISLNTKKFKSLLKKGTITLCTISTIGTIGYDLYLNNKLDKIEISQDYIDDIKKYYKNVNIFIMNDSQGINLNIGFWKDSYSDYLKKLLDGDVIDASSLLYNKTNHINMLLEHNLSVSEIKKLNNEGIYTSIKQVAADNGMPAMLQNLSGNIGKLVFGSNIELEDYKKFITETLINTEQPIVIYSCGANDIMFLTNANPISVKTNEEKNEYAKNMLNDDSTIDTVISNIEQNFLNILSINSKTKIVALSIYNPKLLQDEKYDYYNEAIEKYNLKLKKLCLKYNIIYIDEAELGKIYNTSDDNFHINEIGHKALASIIINEIYNNLDNKNKINLYNTFTYDNEGIYGFYEDLINDINNVSFPSKEEIDKNPYVLDVYLSQTQEKIIDAKTCEKVKK